jgi:hypothetical protein
MSTYNGFLYGPSGQQIYPTPRESPGKFKPRPTASREVKRSISSYDHAELVTLSISLCCRIPALRAAIRDKNSWAFSNWLPIYMGENEKWGEEAEDYLTHEVMPNALFREHRQDFPWAMRMSGIGMDIHGDDLCIFTEDENHNAKIDIVPSPRIGSGMVGNGWISSMFSNTLSGSSRADGLGVVTEGEYKDAGIYSGMIKRGNQWVAARVLGYKENGEPFFSDIPLGRTAHFGCEMEFFGQGRGVPRIAASVLHLMKKEEIDDLLLKGLALAAQRAVIHKLPPGKDAAMARGNAIQETEETVVKRDADGNVITDDSGNVVTEQKKVYVETTPDGNVLYIGSDEDLAGIDYDNPTSNVEAYAIRVLMECLSDLGWSYELLDGSGVSRAPTRLVTQKANNSIYERQSIEEIRSVQFFQHAIAKGMENGRISKNRNGTDPYKWGVGFPATISIDQGNDVTAALNRLKMGLTNERIEVSKDGYIAKNIRKQRRKEVTSILQAAHDAWEFAVKTLGHKDFTFQQAMELFYQPNPNSTAQPQQIEPATPPK